MNLWIETARDSLVRDDRGRRLRAPQRRRAAHAHASKPNLVQAAREVDGAGARASSSPSRASTAPRCSPARASSRCPPTRSRPCSTRPARATRSPGGFVGYIAAHPDEELGDELLRRAMAYGTALASFNVEEFGTERVPRLTADEIVERVAELQRITTFAGRPDRAALGVVPDHVVAGRAP